MKHFVKEFKEFISRGSVMDLAVGVIIGGAFQAIVASFTGDIVSPLLGLLVNTDLTELTATVGEVEIRYGAFITAIINFILMALVIFLFLKAIRSSSEKLKKKEEQ